MDRARQKMPLISLQIYCSSFARHTFLFMCFYQINVYGFHQEVSYKTSAVVSATHSRWYRIVLSRCGGSTATVSSMSSMTGRCCARHLSLLVISTGV